MNTNASTAAVIGIGAIGTILAYFGLQYVSEDEVSSDVEAVAESVNNEVSTDVNTDVEKETPQTNTSTKTPELKDTVKTTTNDTNEANEVEPNTTAINKNGIKLEVTEAISNKKTDENKWSEYWEGEYKNQDKDKKEIVVDKL